MRSRWGLYITFFILVTVFVFYNQKGFMISYGRIKSRDVAEHSLSNETLEDLRSTHFITVKGDGRLGNQMFEIASLFATAYRHNFTPILSGYRRIKQCFNLENTDIRFENTKFFNESKLGVYNAKIENLSHDTNWTIVGYFQSWKYFHTYRNEIKTLFSFKHKTEHKAEKILKSLNGAGRTFVGVHIRRGDKTQSEHLKMGNSVATPEYIEKALQFFRRNMTNPIFVVVSDDFSWSKVHVKGNDVKFLETGNPELDLTILSLCNHTIITVGSFGWWGAYLNGGVTIYYSNYPRRGSWLATQFSIQDYYLPEWIGME